MLLKSMVVCLVLANAGYFLWARGIAMTAEPPLEIQGPSLTLASESGGAPRASRGGSAHANSAGAVNGADSTLGGTGDAAGAPASAGSAGDSDRAQTGLLTTVKRCITVGPFRDVSEAAHAAGTLRGGGYDPRQRVADGEVWAGVWVYLPLPASRAAGDQMLGRLKTAGFDDALEMPGPNDTSVISLGLYSEPKRAQARVVQAQELGFNPAIAERKRTGNVYWIDIDLKPTDRLLNPAELQGEAGRILRPEVKSCPSMGGAAP